MAAERLKRGLAWAAALAVPLALLAAWLVMDQRYPTDDAGNYFWQSQEIYRSLVHHGLFSALELGYFHRHFRPVLQPFVGVPFLVLNGGNVTRSVAQAQWASYAVLLTYLYLLLCEALPRGRAALATAFVGTLPWLLSDYFFFNSEPSLITCAFAAFYHARKARFFASLRHSAWLGFWVGLGICFRPAEGAVPVLGMPLLAYTAVALRRRTISRRDLACVFPPIVLVVAGLGSAFLRHEEFPAWVLVPVAALLALPLFLERRYRLTKPFVVALTLSAALPGLWFTPAAYQVLDWIRACTFGDFIETAMPRETGRLEFIGLILREFSGLYLVPVLALAAAVAWQGRKRLASLRGEARALLACLGLAIVLYPMVGLLARNGEFRRYYIINAALVYLVTAALLFRARGAAAVAGGALLAGYVAFHGAFVLELAREPWSARALALRRIVPDEGSYYATVSTHKPLSEAYEAVSRVLPRDGLARVGIALRSSSYDLCENLNPDALTVMAQEHDRDWYFSYPYQLGARDARARIERVRHDLDWLLVGYDAYQAPFSSETFERLNSHTYALAVDVLEARQAHALAGLGLEERWHDQSFVLFKIQPLASP